MWVTIEAIAERYRVGTDRLLDYARRGNLPCRRVLDGETFVDEAVVATLFRPRSGAAVSYAEPTGPHLGILGIQRLGGELGAREDRKRAVRASPKESGTFVHAPRKATG
jgi:hypothetical protein